LAWLRIAYHPIATTPTVAADSVYMTLQVSDDGINWITTTPTSTYEPAGLGSITNGADLLEIGSSNSFACVLRQRTGATASGSVFFKNAEPSGTAPTWQQIHGWTYLRLIVQSDVTGRYDAHITGYTSN
jgi:hypothetical protein